MNQFPATDKADLGYLPTYLEIAARIGIRGAVCEIGVDRGGSLLLWRLLFPSGLIVGVDHDPNCKWPAGTYSLIADQTDPRLPEALAALTPGFDLIVDDASHEGALSLRTFDLLWPLVLAGGYYVVEDWHIGLPEYAGSYGGRDGRMLDVAAALWPRSADHDVHSVTYRLGQIIVRKAG